MALEIERKFLVIGSAWREKAHAVIPMSQGYLNDQNALKAGKERVYVRVRVQGNQAFINFKSHEVGPSRQEFEYPIPADDGRSLMALCVNRLIEKRRHLLYVGSHLWEIDEFLGDNAGLIVAEVELASVDELFERPAWLGQEVTDDWRYYNVALANYPYRYWEER